MKLEAASFFQPVTLKSDQDKGRAPVISGATDRTHDLILKDDRYIAIKRKEDSVFTYVTIYNTCWFIPLETVNEPAATPSPESGETEKKSKRNPVAKVKLRPTDKVHTGPSET